MLGVVAAGCGSTAAFHPAPSQVRELHWHERPCAGVRVDVERLIVGRVGWRIEATVANLAGPPLTIERPHHPGSTYFGIVHASTHPTAAELHASLRAQRFAPRLPRELERGARWRGFFSAPCLSEHGVTL